MNLEEEKVYKWIKSDDGKYYTLAYIDENGDFNVTDLRGFMIGTGPINQRNKAIDPVKHYRNRSGTADQHTSFGVGFNILTTTKMKGIDIDYALAWKQRR